MSLQIIENSQGKPTGVFIPMKEWAKLKKMYKDLESLESENTNVLNEIRISFEELVKVENNILSPRPVNELIDEL